MRGRASNKERVCLYEVASPHTILLLSPPLIPVLPPLGSGEWGRKAAAATTWLRFSFFVGRKGGTSGVQIGGWE